MRARMIALLLAMGLILMACTNTPTPQPPAQNGIWDQSNFETATWN